MRTFSKPSLKILSALIVLTALNIRFVCAHLFIAGYINAPMPSACAVTEAVCYLLIIYINLSLHYAKSSALQAMK